MRKRLLHLLRLAPLALLLASSAWAQTTGTIIGVVTDASTGKPVAGALIVARSPGLQGEQTAVTDEKGAYRLPQLPPGQYTLAVQLGGYRPAERSDITLRIDKTIRANLAVVPEAVQLQEQQVRTGIAPVINVGSAESGSVLTKEFVASVPIGRTFDATAVAAPTAKGDTFGVGFAGAQSPENNYILDGLSVTDPRYGTNGVSLLNNFVQEIDVKTGSFMPEYGRATGGILNVVTKSGSNEFHGSVFGNWQPGALTPDGKVLGRAGEAVAFRTTPGDGAYNADFGFELGGPVIQDRLWFYAGFAPVISRTSYDRFLRENALSANASNDPYTDDRLRDAQGNFVQTVIPGTTRNFKTFDRAYQFNGKLTYLLDENNNFTLSGFGNPAHNTDILLDSFNQSDSRRFSNTDTSSYDLIGRYAGKFMQKRLIVEGVGGWHRQTLDNLPNWQDGVNQATTPTIRWRNRTALGNSGPVKHTIDMFENVPSGYCVGDADKCTVDRYTTGGYGYNEQLSLNRYAGKLSASYLLALLGSHNWKAGVDYEHTNYEQNKGYSGGGTYDYRTGGGANGFLLTRGYGLVNSPTFGTSDPNLVTYLDRVGTTSQSNSTGLYLQDSWQVANSGLTMNAGLRWEAQNMKDTKSSATSLSITDNWAPRAQVIYDFTGTGRSKISANWGRFYENIPLDMADRAFGSETQVSALYQRSGSASCNIDSRTPGFRAPKAFDPRASCPLPVSPNGVITDVDGNSVLFSQVGSVSPVAPDIKGMYVDQFGGSVEYELFQDFSVGFEYAGRRLGRVIEDMSSNDGTTYFIGNPGESRPYTYQGREQNPRVVTTVDPTTGRELQVPFPKPVRDYDGFTFKVGKNLSSNWLAQASYTYSQLRGNYAGLLRPENDQLDPNITSEYDLPTLMTNKNGLLPGDVTHQVKIFGAYVFNVSQRLNVTAGGALNAASGRPVNALAAHPLYGAGESFLIQRGMAGRTPVVTSADLRGKVEYKLTAPYAVQFTIDIFNVFNSQETLSYDENYTFDTAQPIIGAQCKAKNSAGKKDPIAAIQSDCPDLAYLRSTDGRPVTINPSYGRPNSLLGSFQSPIAFRFGLALSF